MLLYFPLYIIAVIWNIVFRININIRHSESRYYEILIQNLIPWYVANFMVKKLWWFRNMSIWEHKEKVWEWIAQRKKHL